MNEPDHHEFTMTMLLRLMAALHDTTPALLEELLKRFGFRPEDVTFRSTLSGRTWTEINRWPWQVPTRSL